MSTKEIVQRWEELPPIPTSDSILSKQMSAVVTHVTVQADVGSWRPATELPQVGRVVPVIVSATGHAVQLYALYMPRNIARVDAAPVVHTGWVTLQGKSLANVVAWFDFNQSCIEALVNPEHCTSAMPRILGRSDD